jgi:hypothetical protein
MLKTRVVGIVIWLIIAGIAGAIGHFGFGVSFWLVATLTIISLAVNGWIIDWEDRQPGGWSNPEGRKD